jgi:RPAP1-like, C-terminal
MSASDDDDDDDDELLLAEQRKFFESGGAASVRVKARERVQIVVPSANRTESIEEHRRKVALGEGRASVSQHGQNVENVENENYSAKQPMETDVKLERVLYSDNIVEESDEQHFQFVAPTLPASSIDTGFPCAKKRQFERKSKFSQCKQKTSEPIASSSNSRNNMMMPSGQMPTVEIEKLAWMKDVDGEGESKSKRHYANFVEEMRFDAKGSPRNVQGQRQHVVASSLDDERELHHHGDEPGQPGYTIRELFRLCRSTVAAQRVFALQVIAAIVRRLRSGGWATTTIAAETVWRRLVDVGLPLLLRASIDDTSSIAIASGLAALHALLCPAKGSFDSVGAARTSDRGCRSCETMPLAPLLAASPFRVEADEHRAADATDEGHAEQDRVAQWAAASRPIDTARLELGAKYDLVAALLHAQLLARCRYLLAQVPSATDAAAAYWVDVLLVCAHHSADACAAIVRVDGLVGELVRLANTDGDALTVAKLARLLRIVMQSGVDTCEALQRAGGNALSALLARWLASDGGELAIESLRIWRVSALLGFYTAPLASVFPVLAGHCSAASQDDSPRVQLRAAAVFDMCSALLPLVNVDDDCDDGDNDDDDICSVHMLCWSHVAPLLPLALSSLGARAASLQASSCSFVAAYLQCLRRKPMLWNDAPELDATQRAQRHRGQVASILDKALSGAPVLDMLEALPTHALRDADADDTLYAQWPALPVAPDAELRCLAMPSDAVDAVDAFGALARLATVCAQLHGSVGALTDAEPLTLALTMFLQHALVALEHGARVANRFEFVLDAAMARQRAVPLAAYALRKWRFAAADAIDALEQLHAPATSLCYRTALAIVGTSLTGEQWGTRQLLANVVFGVSKLGALVPEGAQFNVRGACNALLPLYAGYFGDGDDVTSSRVLTRPSFGDTARSLFAATPALLDALPLGDRWLWQPIDTLYRERRRRLTRAGDGGDMQPLPDNFVGTLAQLLLLVDGARGDSSGDTDADAAASNYLRLLKLFLVDDSAFLEERARHAIDALRRRLVDRCAGNFALAPKCHENAVVPLLIECVEHFVAVSAGSIEFGRCVHVLLRCDAPAQVRKTMWLEHGASLASMALVEPIVDERGYLWPPDADVDLLYAYARLYAAARHGAFGSRCAANFLHNVVRHHLAMSIWAGGDPHSLLLHIVEHAKHRYALFDLAVWSSGNPTHLVLEPQPSDIGSLLRSSPAFGKRHAQLSRCFERLPDRIAFFQLTNSF